MLFELASVAAVVLCAASVAVTVAGGLASRPWLAGAGRGLIVGLPMAVGLYAWSRPIHARFGQLLFALGASWSLTTLAGSSNATLYGIGRLAGWVVEVGLLYTLLAFPSGRLTGRSERVLVAVAAWVVAVAYLPTALLIDRYPTPSPWTTCTATCPGNAFQVVHHEPGFVSGVIATRQVLTVLVFAGAAALLARRVRRASRLTRLMLTPVLAVAVMLLAGQAAWIVLRWATGATAASGVAAWVIALLVPLMAAGFLVGLLRWRLFAGSALERLARALSGHPDAERLRQALAQALGDPTLRLAFRDRGGHGDWVDAAGERVDLHANGGRYRLAEVSGRGSVVAAIVYDEALGDQPELLRAAASLTTLALENERLIGEVRTSLQQVQASRARIQATADAERRRIERDLHDGAQQHLISLRIKLALADEVLQADPARGHALLREIDHETVEALEDVRSLAHGVYPALLTQRGLADALRGVAIRSAVPTTLHAEGLGRYAPEIENAVYFCCLEAMQNAVKHAHGARAVEITLSAAGDLRFEVSDDGAGFDASALRSGAGMGNMRDRLAAVGGELSIRSAPGAGTHVVGTVPARRRADRLALSPPRPSARVTQSG